MGLIKSFFKAMADMWSGGLIDKGMVIITFILIGSLLFLCSLPFLIYYDSMEMKIQHCHPTEQTKTYIITGTILVGKIMVPTVQQVTERLYICDDYNRWR